MKSYQDDYPDFVHDPSALEKAEGEVTRHDARRLDIDELTRLRPFDEINAERSAVGQDYTDEARVNASFREIWALSRGARIQPWIGKRIVDDLLRTEMEYREKQLVSYALDLKLGRIGIPAVFESELESDDTYTVSWRIPHSAWNIHLSVGDEEPLARYTMTKDSYGWRDVRHTVAVSAVYDERSRSIEEGECVLYQEIIPPSGSDAVVKENAFTPSELNDPDRVPQKRVFKNAFGWMRHYVHENLIEFDT